MAFLPLLRFGSKVNGAELREVELFPHALLTMLERRFGLAAGQFGVDLGPGSGRLAQLFLKHGYSVLCPSGRRERTTAMFAGRGVDPSEISLQEANGALATAHLADGSVDFVLSERALYATNAEALKQELRRILRPNGVIVLITDNRVYGGGTQSEEYEDLLRRYCRRFREKQQPFDVGQLVAEFFQSTEIYQDAFVGVQDLTLHELLAQTRRLSIFPAEDDPNADPLESALERFFARWAFRGALSVPVVCRIACGRMEQLEQTLEEKKLMETIAVAA